MSDFTKSKMTATGDNYSTPIELYNELDSTYHFNDDPCPLNPNPVVDGLSREWGSRTFLNPPYSNPTPWVKKAYIESQKGKIVVALLRGDTSTRWFHDWVLPFAEISFIKGRIKFNGKPAPFPSIIAIWDRVL